MQSPVIPIQFRANDITKHIVSVDSRFRRSPEQTTAADFYYEVTPPIKNVLRIRITSIEFPNNYLFFTAERGNTTLRILYKVGAAAESFVLTVPDGNYTAISMEEKINEILSGPGGLSWLSVTFDEGAGRFVFVGNQYFGVDTTYMSWSRPFDYGLGYYLGFSRGLHKSIVGAMPPTVSSDRCANFAGDNYVFLKINDYECVQHSTGTSILTALAKITLREPKNFMVFDDYASQHAKEVVFPAPQNLARLHIQVLDAYGEVLDLCSANLSFSIEVLEIKNSSLYTAVRDSLGFVYK